MILRSHEIEANSSDIGFWEADIVVVVVHGDRGRLKIRLVYLMRDIINFEEHKKS